MYIHIHIYILEEREERDLQYKVEGAPHGHDDIRDLALKHMTVKLKLTGRPFRTKPSLAHANNVWRKTD